MKAFGLYIIIIYSIVLFSCTNEKQRLGEEIIQKIEAYRLANGYLPEHPEEIGIEETEQSPVFYRKKSDSTYEVWYGGSLGESMCYDFKSKKWVSDKQ